MNNKTKLVSPLCVRKIMYLKLVNVCMYIVKYIFAWTREKGGRHILSYSGEWVINDLKFVSCVRNNFFSFKFR